MYQMPYWVWHAFKLTFSPLIQLYSQRRITAAYVKLVSKLLETWWTACVMVVDHVHWGAPTKGSSGLVNTQGGLEIT